MARELIWRAVGRIFQKYATPADFGAVVEWFDGGGYLRLPDAASAAETLASLGEIPGLLEHTSIVNADAKSSAEERVAAAEFLLEGLVGLKKLSRSEERGYVGAEERRQPEIGFEDELDSQKTRLN